VGPGIGAWLDWPNAAYVKKVEEVQAPGGGKPGFIRIHRMMEDGTDVLEMDFPAVISVVKEINEPRVPSLKGKMNAKKVVIPKWNADDLKCDRTKIGLSGSPTIVAKSYNPPPRKGGGKIEGATTDEKAQKLVAKLREMKLI
jgi:electron transfer flavoprotein beta subunit